jgi:hypothetical protein
MTMTKTMFLEIGRKRFQVASFEQASRSFARPATRWAKDLLTSEATLSATFPTIGAHGRALPMWPVPSRCTTTAWGAEAMTTWVHDAAERMGILRTTLEKAREGLAIARRPKQMLHRPASCCATDA